MKRLILIFFIAHAAAVTAERVVTVCGHYTYVVPENISLEQAKQIAIEKAQIQCIADEFGTTVSQSVSTHIKNKNGKTDITNVSLGTTEVKGEWLGFVKEPQISTIYQNNMLVLRVSICGKIRKLTNSSIDVHVQLLCNGIEDNYERNDFYEGDQLFMSLNTPISGYVCVYMIDEDLNAFNILPYASNPQGAQFVEANVRHIFFSKHFSKTNEIVDEYAMSCSHDGETNQFVIIFSPNKFSKPSDASQGNNYLRETSFEKLQTWMLASRTKDENMTIIYKTITINKLKK